MTISSRSLRAILIAAIWLPMTNIAKAEILSDGNFDNLEVGTAPDNGDPAGAWSIGINPSHPDDIEDDPNQISIVPTSEFVEGATGNSLSVSPRGVTTHGRFNDRVREKDNEILRATFDVFIPETETSGQPSFHLLLTGGSPFSLQSRGPRIVWNNGRIQANFCGEGSSCTSPRTATLVDETPVNVWQNVQLDIDLANDSYDLSWGTEGGPMELVAPYNRFRSSTQAFLDRFSVTYFNNFSYRRGNAYLDNIDMEILKKDWLGDANLDGQFDSVDIVEVLQAGKYNVDEIAGWSQGDWNRDMRFDRLDIVSALQDGGYGQGPHAASAKQAASDTQLESSKRSATVTTTSGFRLSNTVASSARPSPVDLAEVTRFSPSKIM